MKSGHLLLGWMWSALAFFGCMAIEPVGTLAGMALVMFWLRATPDD